jgi:hypothetical protein
MKKSCSFLLVATLALLWGACGGDMNSGAIGTGVTESGPEPAVSHAVVTEKGTVADFDECVAALQPVCDVRDADTLEEMEMETPCASTKVIPIPTTDGGAYGPVTIPGGPYGSVVMWNEGAGTEFVNEVNFLERICIPFGVESFGEPESVSDELLNTRGLDYSLYTIFRPACMKEGEKYPVITWANGTCGLTHGYTGLLATEASHGFVIIASNSTWTASTTSPDGIPVQLHALDYAKALNEDPNSVFYQKLDLDNIGAAGHSQGSMATSDSASDSRIKSTILWNGGTSNDKPFVYVSGDRDVGDTDADDLASDTNRATQPGAWVFYHQILETGGSSTGHLLLMEQPDRAVELSIAWWKWRLKDDQEAKNMFIGDDCGLCNRDAEFEYGHNRRLRSL